VRDRFSFCFSGKRLIFIEVGIRTPCYRRTPATWTFHWYTRFFNWSTHTFINL